MLTLRRALALGALHGPAELLPVSSSGHLTAIPWLLGWDYDTLEPELRKAFEVTLHAGTAAALLLSLHEEIEPKGLVLMVSATAPPAAAGLVFERAIERHAGTPPAIAAGLVVGSAAILLSERAPSARGIEDAGVVDALWLGLAETLALLPGVSR